MMKYTLCALGFFLAFAAILITLPYLSLGASLPSGTASFETSLQSGVTSSASSMTLTANSVRGGGSLSGYQCFTVDEGSAQAETICGTVSGTTVSSLSRGISQSTGTTTVAALQFAHRRGANVKITDFPLIQILKEQANGEDTYPTLLSYASGVTPSAASNLVDKEYADSLVFSGLSVLDASTVAEGVVEIATQIEAASSTTNGTGSTLALPSSMATSSFNSATAPLRVVMTDNSGKIDSGFLTPVSPIGAITAYASTTAPTGWLLANGQAVSRTTYANLYLVLGTSYGAGDGSTTFNLPDVTGKGIVMASSTQSALQGLNRANMGAIGTTTSHTQTLAELVAHTHTIAADNTDDSDANGTSADQGNATPNSISTNSAGGGAAFNTLDPYIILQYIIKY